MIKKKNVVCPSLCAMLVVTACFFVQAAQASTVIVGTCKTGVQFATIQAAVNAAPTGSTIDVCPGTYPEQVLITKKLTLTGIPTAGGTQDAAVISPPAGGVIVNTTDQQGAVAAQVLVQNTSGPVVISNLTVDGKGNQYTSDDLRGICYQDASGTVKNVAVRNEIPNDIPTGDQSGQGILVETTNSPSASLTVQNSSVHNYNKNGIVARYTGATLIATGNYVQGSGPIDTIAQNGIELAFNGATGSIKNNTVIDNFYTPNSNSSSDILLFDAKENGSIVVSGNILGNSNIAIALFTTTPGTYGDGVNVSANKIFGTSTFDGIDVCTNSNIITGNTIFNSAESGIHLDASCGGTGTANNVSGNTIEESACAGILTDPGAGTAGSNTFFTVPFPATSSTASCSFPGGQARAKSAAKFKP
jgi:parallel beta-helix repeat protein